MRKRGTLKMLFPKVYNYRALDGRTTERQYETKTWLWVGLGILGLLILSEDSKKAVLGQLGQVEPELFKVPRGRLVLKHEDTAISEDPVLQCLERQGWNVKRVQEIQADIAAKMTPNIFTGKTEPLTGAEKMLQEAIDRCLERMKASRSLKAGQPSLFSGPIMNCESWYEDPYTGWHCFIYAPSCSGQAVCKSAGDPRQIKTCVETKQVEPKSDRYSVKWLTRCARYAPSCSSIQCLKKPAPMPITREISEKEVRTLAQMMAKEENEALEIGKELYRRILEYGGIRPQRGGESYELRKKGERGPGYEEYMEIPKYLHRRHGMTSDDMATELGFKDESEFLATIRRDVLRRRELPKGRSYWTTKDFMQKAEQYLLTQQRTLSL